MHYLFLMQVSKAGQHLPRHFGQVFFRDFFLLMQYICQGARVHIFQHEHNLTYSFVNPIALHHEPRIVGTLKNLHLLHYLSPQQGLMFLLNTFQSELMTSFVHFPTAPGPQNSYSFQIL
ncbi:hypothetical protein Mapa_005831 [Marchantia paleacea]|nr:hypothetical protein Mapa_005831 [Marchantia paleacea]